MQEQVNAGIVTKEIQYITPKHIWFSIIKSSLTFTNQDLVTGKHKDLLIFLETFSHYLQEFGSARSLGMRVERKKGGAVFLDASLNLGCNGIDL